MKCRINGEAREIRDGMTVRDLLAEMELGGQPVAVEINRNLVPRAAQNDRRLNDGDAVEIVHFVGGG